METVIKKRLFGGEIVFILYDIPTEIAIDIIEETYEEALRLQKIFNFYDKKSELSKLNKSKKIIPSPELFQVIKYALKLSKITNGSYDISLGKYIKERKEGKSSTLSCSYKDIKIEDKKIILLNPEVLVDLGSIAKGYITDKISDFLKQKGVKEFLIDSRGDIILSGKKTHLIGIQNPREKGDILKIKVKNRAIATSGDYKQYKNNFEKSHIINQKDLSSITVVSKNLYEADAFATAMFTLTKKDRDNIIRKNKNIKFLTIKKGNNFETFNGFEDLVYSNNKNEN